MAGVLAVTILLAVGFMNDFVDPVLAQEGCISHPLPPDIVDKLVSAANIAISQSSAISCSSKENRAETVDIHALATVALLQHSLSSTKEDLSLTKVELENVSLTVTDLTAKTKNLETGLTEIQSTLTVLRNETAELRKANESGLTEIQSTLTVLRNEIAELREAYESVTSNSAKCKDGWFLFQNSCYFFSTAKATWQNGRQQCLDLGADYVKISSDAELTFILSVVVEDTWIGLNDLQTEGNMQWSSDGTEHQTNKAWWYDGEPNNKVENEDCVHMYFYGGRKLLNDNVCTNSFFYLCEKKAEATN